MIHVMDISESVQLLLSSKTCVIDRFYDHLLTEFPQLRHHFENHNLRTQASMLTVALASVEAYYVHRFPATEHYLKVLGNRHFHQGVRVEDFPSFQLALLKTLEEFFAEDWQPALATQWSDALELAIKTMQEGYKDTYTV